MSTTRSYVRRTCYYCFTLQGATLFFNCNREQCVVAEGTVYFALYRGKSSERVASVLFLLFSFSKFHVELLQFPRMVEDYGVHP